MSQSLVRFHRLRKWQRSGLRQWFDDRSVPPPAQADEVFDEWLASTGGWWALLEPRLKHAIGRSCQSKEFGDGMPWDSDGELRRAVGVGDDVALGRVLRLVHQLEEVRREDVGELAGELDLSVERTVHAFDHLVDLALLDGTPDGHRVDAVLGQKTARAIE
jgi:hypothetical protein